MFFNVLGECPEQIITLHVKETWRVDAMVGLRMNIRDSTEKGLTLPSRHECALCPMSANVASSKAERAAGAPLVVFLLKSSELRRIILNILPFIKALKQNANFGNLQ